MLQLINLPTDAATLSPFSAPGALEEYVRSCGCDGVEMIYGGEGEADVLPRGLTVGYHLGFYPDWLDFWQGDTGKLERKFGARSVWEGFYGGRDRQALLDFFAADFRRARQTGAQYVVFHVTDFSIEEGYTFRWEHSHEQIIDASADLLNQVLAGEEWGFTLLLENLFSAGFTMTDPALTARLLERVNYPDTGILLDTGHLLCTNPALTDEREGAAYLHSVLDAHGSLCSAIRGVHLHRSLSAAYRRARGDVLPQLTGDYYRDYADFYEHIKKIDPHLPFTTPAIAPVIERLEPCWLTHELSAADPEKKRAAVLLQQSCLRNDWGGKEKFLKK